MAMGAWVTKVISEATRLGAPDLAPRHGSLTAAEMVAVHGRPRIYLNANPKELENFGEAMKSNSLFSLRGVLGELRLTGVGKIAISAAASAIPLSPAE